MTLARGLRFPQSPFRRPPVEAGLEAGEELDALEASEPEVSLEGRVGADGRYRPRTSRFANEALELFEHFEHGSFAEIARTVHAEKRGS